MDTITNFIRNITKKQLITGGIILGILLILGLTFAFVKQKAAENLALAEKQIPEPIYYQNEDEIPDGTYCIEHSYENTVIYYPLLKAYNTFEDEPIEYITSEAPSRIVWTNMDANDLQIPTMYNGDRLIYKSSTYIPTDYYIEKMKDNGFTFGVSGLYQDASGNYRYDEDSSYINDASSAAGFHGIEADSIYFVSVGDTRITEDTISPSGAITGLEKGKQYLCDIRMGTEMVENAYITADTHLFSSMETYHATRFTYITPYIAEIEMSAFAKTGYYEINAAGLFRYLPDCTKEQNSDITLTADDYNHPYYVTNEDGAILGTVDGLVYDHAEFITEDEYFQSYSYHSDLYYIINGPDDRTDYGDDVDPSKYDSNGNYTEETENLPYTNPASGISNKEEYEGYKSYDENNGDIKTLDPVVYQSNDISSDMDMEDD